MIVDIDELPTLLAANAPVAAIDLGTKTIGLAVSDRSLSFAHPRPVIMRKTFTVDSAAAAFILQGVLDRLRRLR